ncbi:MAG: hypothetical protein IKW53_00145 [Clostridia bacterium]|nr:hypothetical protein [Clostridia bacterium]
MIKNHNIEFIYNNIASLRFPDGMRFDSENRTDTEDSFQLVSPDGRLRLCIEFFRSTKSARELIEELYSESEHDFVMPPYSVTTPTGLEGYLTTYKIGDECYEECTLDFGGDVHCNFWFLYNASNPCNRDIYKQVKADLLENIRRY